MLFLLVELNTWFDYYTKNVTNYHNFIGQKLQNIRKHIQQKYAEFYHHSYNITFYESTLNFSYHTLHI